MQKKQNKQPVKKEESSLIQILSGYVPYWPLFLVFMLLSMTGAYFYLRYTLPKYEATATIIIKDEKKGYDDSKLMESLDMINTKKIIENEIEVLQSRTLMNAVVRKLHLYVPLYQEGKIHSVLAYQTAPVLIEAQNPDSLLEAFRVDLDYDAKKGIVLINKSFSGPINSWIKTPFGTLKFTKNERYVPGVISKPYFFSIVPVTKVAAMMLPNLKVSASSKLSSVINLSYREESIKLVEDVLNELIVSYGESALNEKNTLAKNTLAFIEERLVIVSRDLDSIERKLQQYKTGKGAVDISRQGELYLESVNTNDKRLIDINMQMAVMDQLEKSASSPGSIGVIPSTLGVNDAALTLQINNLSGLQMQYDKLKTTVAENNPLLVSLTEQINQVKPTILNNIRSQKLNLIKSRDNLNTSGGMFNSALSTIPQKERQLVEISRDQNIKNGIYSFLLQKREESELSYASTISDSRVVNYAMASKYPVSPNRFMVYFMAIAIALVCPIAFVTIRETLSPKILYRHEIDSLTTLPIVGEVSFNKLKDVLVVKTGVRTVIAEEFRKIRVSLLSLGVSSHHKKILITSSISGEGKSFIAANLATSISLTGKRVVLVDMDLHNPGLGKYFGITENIGVSDYLIGQKQYKQIVTGVDGNENLFYISSGTLQQDSSELLENGKVQNLINQLDNDFDIVVIDTAPVVLITDAYLLSSLCDATLYVVRHKFTPKMLLKRVDESMNINPLKNAAIIFNGLRTRGFFRNNYGYGYNYVYSYDNKKIKKNKS